MLAAIDPATRFIVMPPPSAKLCSHQIGQSKYHPRRRRVREIVVSQKSRISAATRLLTCSMRGRVVFLFPIFLSLILVRTNAQTLVPTTTYTLHAHKEHYSSNLPSTLVHLLPDQSLLILIPQDDGKWVLKRLAAWNTDTPDEQTITFAGQPPKEGDSGSEQLQIDPTNAYAVIRIKSYTGNVHPVPQNQSAVIVVVDLHSFTIVSQRTTADLLLAASDWSFADNGLLIARVMTDRLTVKPPHPKQSWSYLTITDTYEAAALTLPDLKPSMRCGYELFLDNREGDHRRDRYLSKVGEGCAALVALAHVPSAENLPDGPPRPIPYGQLAGPSCELIGKSPSVKFGLYGCQTGHEYLDGMIHTTDTRHLRILSIPDGKEVLTVPLQHNTTPYPSLLADAGSHTWLLILRDGIKLEAYRLL